MLSTSTSTEFMLSRVEALSASYLNRLGASSSLYPELIERARVPRGKLLSASTQDSLRQIGDWTILKINLRGIGLFFFN